MPLCHPIVVAASDLTLRHVHSPALKPQVYSMTTSTMETMAARAHGAKYIHQDSSATFEYGFMQVSRTPVFMPWSGNSVRHSYAQQLC